MAAPARSGSPISTSRSLQTGVDEIRAPIACNQVEYHAMLDQTRLLLVADCEMIPLVAYSPLAQGPLAADAVLKAIGRKHGASAAQVGLKWLLDQDGVAAIPKASRAESQQANLDALKLSLTMRIGRRSRPCRRTNGV